ncbi:MAG: hypothetical protein JWR44_2582 [Hymenobacter sp.]|nr:hypothetical protein [Hymenobacter sp.]
MMEEPEESRLDQTLRDKFENFDLTPSAGVWAGIEQRMDVPPPVRPPRRPPLPVPLLFSLVALLAGLVGWLLPHPSTHSTRLNTETAVAASTTTAPSHVGMRAQKQPLRSGAVSLRAGSENAAQLQQPELSASRRQTTRSKTTLRQQAISKSLPGLNAETPAIASESNGITSPAATSYTTAPPQAASEITLVATRDSAAAASTEATPATLQTLASLERQTLVQLPSIATLAPGTPYGGTRNTLLGNLRAERAELLRLQRHTDSLLLVMGDLPGAPLVATSATPPTDTARPRPMARRWSLLLSAAPEQNTLTLQGPEGDSLTALRRNHETGRTGFSAALLAEYRVSPRLSVGAGVGFNTFGADLRLTTKNTEVSVRYETATTRTTSFYTTTNQTYSIRIIQVPQQSPIFNSSGQVIGYNTVYVPRPDTVFTTTVQRDSIHSIRETVTPFISKRETVSTKLLQPNYRFVTLPLQMRYRLTMGPGRWWADAAAGAQLQFFLGGTQVVTNDGENFRTETVTAGSGPFRALNVALSGSMALNYALSNRLSVSVAPSIRWQALSVYKPETGLRQQSAATGLMFGVRLGL